MPTKEHEQKTIEENDFRSYDRRDFVKSQMLIKAYIKGRIESIIDARKANKLSFAHAIRHLDELKILAIAFSLDWDDDIKEGKEVYGV